MTITLTYGPDDADAGRRALVADALVGALWNFREELGRVARGKTDAAEAAREEAEEWRGFLQDTLAAEGIDLDALWS